PVRARTSRSWTGARPDARASLPHDIPVVLDVVRELVRLDRAEAGAGEILPGLRLAPHRAETFAALRERHSHAVHARDRVEQCAERMIDVRVVVARAADVLHKIDAVVLERSIDALQHV